MQGFLWKFLRNSQKKGQGILSTRNKGNIAPKKSKYRVY